MADSSFVVTAMDRRDRFHRNAVFVFKKILENKNKIKILIPPLGIYKIIVSLNKKGMKSDFVEQKILRLLNINEIIVNSISESPAFKHCRELLKKSDDGVFLRTADFFIASIGTDYNAQILTFDKKIVKRIKPFYKKIYYCSNIGKMKDETEDFLQNFKGAIG